MNKLKDNTGPLLAAFFAGVAAAMVVITIFFDAVDAKPDEPSRLEYQNHGKAMIVLDTKTQREYLCVHGVGVCPMEK